MRAREWPSSERVGEVVGTDVHADHAAGRLGHGQPVARRVDALLDVQQIDLAVLQEHLSAGVDEHGRIVDPAAGPLRQTRHDVQSGLSRRPAQHPARRPGDFRRQLPCRRMGPAQIQALRQDHDLAALPAGLSDHLHGPGQVLLRPATFDQHLPQGQLDPTLFRHYLLLGQDTTAFEIGCPLSGCGGERYRKPASRCLGLPGGCRHTCPGTLCPSGPCTRPWPSRRNACQAVAFPWLSALGRIPGR